MVGSDRTKQGNEKHGDEKRNASSKESPRAPKHETRNPPFDDDVIRESACNGWGIADALSS